MLGTKEIRSESRHWNDCRYVVRQSGRTRRQTRTRPACSPFRRRPACRSGRSTPVSHPFYGSGTPGGGRPGSGTPGSGTPGSGTPRRPDRNAGAPATPAAGHPGPVSCQRRQAPLLVRAAIARPLLDRGCRCVIGAAKAGSLAMPPDVRPAEIPRSPTNTDISCETRAPMTVLPVSCVPDAWYVGVVGESRPGATWSRPVTAPAEPGNGPGTARPPPGPRSRAGPATHLSRR
jgi:hypothetical protein